MSDLPHGWAEARLDELAATEVAAITDGPFGSNLKTEHYKPSGPRVIRLQNIGDGRFHHERAHISPDRFEALRKHEACEGDVIVAALGETLPRACIVPPNLGPSIVKADCIRVRIHEEINPRFVSAMLNSPPIRRYAAGQISGVGRPRLNLAKIRSLRVPVPPRAEQNRIVDAIEEQFSRLDQTELHLDQARRNLLRLRTVLLASLTPRDREWTTLGEIAEVAGGVTKDSKRQSDPAFVEVPYLRVANVQRGYLDLGEVTTIRVPLEKAKALRLEPGDVLFTEGGDRDKLGRGWVWEGQISGCIHQNHVFRARLSSDQFSPKFVSLHGNTFGQQWFEEMGKQTTNLASINLKTLKAFPVPRSSIEEQRRLVAEMERSLSILDALGAAIDHARIRAGHLRRSILERAFSGALVPQDQSDEPASVLLGRIATGRHSSRIGRGRQSNAVRT